MGFEQAYFKFIEYHRGLSKGERRRRMEEGLGHGEKQFLQRVWWPGLGHFDHLHPEYEVYKIAFEIQGYGPHLKQVSRWNYADEQQRIRFLSSTGWTLMYFSYDEIKDSSEACLHEIQSLLGRLISRETGEPALSISARCLQV